jgi:hypothetical protein
MPKLFDRPLLPPAFFWEQPIKLRMVMTAQPQIQREWCVRAVQSPLKQIAQPNGRFSGWAVIPEFGDRLFQVPMTGRSHFPGLDGERLFQVPMTGQSHLPGLGAIGGVLTWVWAKHLDSSIRVHGPGCPPNASPLRGWLVGGNPAFTQSAPSTELPIQRDMLDDTKAIAQEGGIPWGSWLK